MGIKSIDLGNVTGPQGPQGPPGASGIIYTVCSTGPSTAIKLATSTESFSLVRGAVASVRFQYANRAENPSLSVNGTGAYPIYDYGTTAPVGSWEAGEIMIFVYDGTSWQMATNRVPLSSSLDSDKEDTAATSKAVKDLSDAIAQKQDTLTFDQTPMAGSTNMVTSGAIAAALAETQGELTFDATPTQNSANPVTSNGIYNALSGKMDTMVVDTTPTSGSNNLVTSGGAYNAIQAVYVVTTTVQYQQSTSGSAVPSGTWYNSPPTATAGRYMWTRVTLTYSNGKTSVFYAVAKNGQDGAGGSGGDIIVDDEPMEGSSNAVSSGGAFTALAGKMDTKGIDGTPTASSQNLVSSGGVYSALAQKAGYDITTYASGDIMALKNLTGKGGCYLFGRNAKNTPVEGNSYHVWCCDGGVRVSVLAIDVETNEVYSTVIAHSSTDTLLTWKKYQPEALPVIQTITPDVANSSIAGARQYWIDQFSTVHFHFRIFTDTDAYAHNGKLFTFPEGYRPGTAVAIQAHAFTAGGTSKPAHLNIATSGEVTLWIQGGKSSDAVALIGCNGEFIAEEIADIGGTETA